MSVLPTRANPRDQGFRRNQAHYDALAATLRQRLAQAAAGGGERHVARHHARGKMLVAGPH